MSDANALTGGLDTHWTQLRDASVAARVAAKRFTPQTPGQEAYWKAMQDRLLVACDGPAGCLAGDTLIPVNRGGKGWKIRLDHLVVRTAGGHVGGNKIPWRPDIQTRVGRAVDGVVRLGNLQDAWESGMKETFLLTTAAARTIRATAEHPFLTDAGVFVKLRDLRPGDRVCVEVGQGGGCLQPKRRDRSRYTKYHPYQRRSKDGYAHFTHRLTVEAGLNGLGLEDYIAVLRTDPVRSAAMTFLPPFTVVHHKDGNHLNNHPSNLVLLAGQGEHNSHHPEFAEHVMSKTGYDEIRSIERWGEEPTYDLEMTDDPHNFLANGFVVHNSGKTLLACQMGADLFKAKRVKSLVFLRPGVSSGRPSGMLPGSLAQKHSPFMFVLAGYLARLLPGQRMAVLTDPETPVDLSVPGVYFLPAEYARGVTLDDCFVFADEAQNFDQGMLRLVTGRQGRNATLVLSGHAKQCDLPDGPGGWLQLLSLLAAHPDPDWAVTRLSYADVLRSGIAAKTERLWDGEWGGAVEAAPGKEVVDAEPPPTCADVVRRGPVARRRRTP